MPRVSVELSDDELRQVRILAAERGVAPPKLIREFLVGLGVGTPRGAGTPVPAPVSDRSNGVSKDAKKDRVVELMGNLERSVAAAKAARARGVTYLAEKGPDGECLHVNQTTVSHGVYCADCAYKLR